MPSNRPEPTEREREQEAKRREAERVARMEAERVRQLAEVERLLRARPAGNA